MKAIICGAGQVGFSIAKYLSEQDADVTVIDQSAELIGKINETLDVQAIRGHASHPQILESAGIEHADTIIAVTHSDEINIVACQVAHSLFQVETKIARVRAESYQKQFARELFTADHIPIDVIISPEREVAAAIARNLGVSGPFETMALATDKITVMGLRCTESCPLINTPLRQLTALFPELMLTVMAIIRDEKTIAPTSTEQMMAGDQVYVAAQASDMTRTIAAFGYEEKQTAGKVAIIGGGNIGSNLLELIEEMPGLSAEIVERDVDRAHAIAERFLDARVTRGDALDAAILDEINIGETDTIVAVTDDEKTNIIASLLARRRGVGRTIALVNQSSYSPLAATLGIDILVNPRAITASTIVHHLRKGSIESVHAIADGAAEIMEFDVLGTSSLAGSTVREIDFPKGVVVGAILHEDSVTVARPNSLISERDRVVLLALKDSVRKTEGLIGADVQYF